MSRAGRWLWGAGGLALVLALLFPPRGVYAGARFLGSAVCAQIAAHSYHAWGQPLPLCARCTGLHWGTLITMVYLIQRRRWRRVRWPTRQVWVILAGLMVLWGVDGVNSLLAEAGGPTLYTPTNAMRLLTGVFSGVAWMLLFWPLWAHAFLQHREPLPLVERGREILWPVTGGLALVAVMEAGGDRIRYVVGLVSVVNVVLALGGVFGILICAFPFLRDRRMSWWGRGVCALTGILVGLGVLTAIAEVRSVLLTGGLSAP